MMKPAFRTSLLIGVAGAAAIGLGALGVAPSATDLPAATAFAPTPSTELIPMIIRRDEPAMRAHGWKLWEYITADHDGRPFWYTWHTKGETIEGKAPDVAFQRPAMLWEGIDPQARPPRGEPARQPSENDRSAPASDRPIVMLQVYFNDPAHEHIRRFHLNNPDNLTAIHAALSAAGQPLMIPAFPHDAITLKGVWVIAKQGQPLTMPVWDPPTGKPATINKPQNWERKVELSSDLNALRERFHVIILSTPELVASANQAINGGDPTLPGPAEVGDYALLVGMHIATKELDDWVWATYWWHDQPDAGPFAAGRPASIASPWDNYLLDITLDADIPSEPGSNPTTREPNICFNPWLEGSLRYGAVSNCLACHQRAAWAPPPAYRSRGHVTRGRIPLDDPEVFGPEWLRLDYVFSLDQQPTPQEQLRLRELRQQP